MRKKPAATRLVGGVESAILSQNSNLDTTNNLPKTTSQVLCPPPITYSIATSLKAILSTNSTPVAVTTVFSTPSAKASIETATVKCTGCALVFCPFSTPFYVHPVLRVLVCKRCAEFYEKSTFPKDADGKDENCRWCGDGGNLICCDSCSNTFCVSCIKRNIGQDFLQKIEELGDDEIWYCLVCAPSPLLPIQRQCAEVLERLRTHSVSNSIIPISTTTAVYSSPNLQNSISNVASTYCNTFSSSRSEYANTLVYSQHSTCVSSSSAVIVPVAAERTIPGNQASYIANGASSTLPSAVLPTSSQFVFNNCQTSVKATPFATVSATATQKPAISTTPAQNPPATTITPSNRSQSNVNSNSNSSDWYIQNVTVANIIKQISDVNASNVHLITRSLRVCLDTFLCDLRRVETNLCKARTSQEISNIVRSFQSIYRFHLFNRVGNLVSRLQEENKLSEIENVKPSTPPVSSPAVSVSSSDSTEKSRSKAEVKFPLLPESSSTMHTLKKTLMIDLTDDVESFSNRAADGNCIESTPLGNNQQQSCIDSVQPSVNISQKSSFDGKRKSASSKCEFNDKTSPSSNQTKKPKMDALLTKSPNYQIIENPPNSNNISDYQPPAGNNYSTLSSMVTPTPYLTKAARIPETLSSSSVETHIESGTNRKSVFEVVKENLQLHCNTQNSMTLDGNYGAFTQTKLVNNFINEKKIQGNSIDFHPREPISISTRESLENLASVDILTDMNGKKLQNAHRSESENVPISNICASVVTSSATLRQQSSTNGSFELILSSCTETPPISVTSSTNSCGQLNGVNTNLPKIVVNPGFVGPTNRILISRNPSRQFTPSTSISKVPSTASASTETEIVHRSPRLLRPILPCTTSSFSSASSRESSPGRLQICIPNNDENEEFHQQMPNHLRCEFAGSLGTLPNTVSSS